jgi:hypothetical protein
MLLVSDQDREYTAQLLRGHWLTGRLTAEEFEQRLGEAWAARYSDDLWRALRWLPVDVPPVRKRESGAAALILSGLGFFTMFFTLGLAFALALPLFVAGWLAGREARRSVPGRAPGAAIAGELIGVVGTVVCLLYVAGCAAILT